MIQKLPGKSIRTRIAALAPESATLHTGELRRPVDSAGTPLLREDRYKQAVPRSGEGQRPPSEAGGGQSVWAPTHQDALHSSMAGAHTQLAAQMKRLPGLPPKGPAVEAWKAAHHPDWRKLSPELKAAVKQSALAGRGTAAELMRAATFKPGPGLHLTGSRADKATFLDTVRRAMVRSPSFRKRMDVQNPDQAHRVRMDLGRNQHGVVIDATGLRWDPPEPGRHKVDLEDLGKYPAVPGGKPHPDATTQEQLMVHFMVEAMAEARGANRHQSHHVAARAAENQYRKDVGQKGETTGAKWGPGRKSFIYRYRNGHGNETVILGPHSSIQQVRYSN
jgi:hypothetical protein